MIFDTFNHFKTKYLVCRYYKNYAITTQRTQKSFKIKNPALKGYSIPAANGGDPPSQIQLHPFTAHSFMWERIYSRNTDEQRRRADANWEDLFQSESISHRSMLLRLRSMIPSAVCTHSNFQLWLDLKLFLIGLIAFWMAKRRNFRYRNTCKDSMEKKIRPQRCGNSVCLI